MITFDKIFKNMKNLGTIFTLLVVLTCVKHVISQPQIKFDTRLHDYGTIREENGPQKAVFIFTNTGNEPLIISSVRASCGCTASNYTKEEIAPGAKGEVEAIYNPAGRPGVFNKSVTVTSNDTKEPTIVLTIKGDVTSKPKSKADNYPSKIGNLKFKTNHLAFQELTNKQVKTDTLGFYNEGKEEITIKGVKDLPAFLTVEIKPQTLKPDEEGVILITYYAEKRNELGYVFDKFNFETTDIDLPDKLIYVSANISYDFSGMTEKQKAKAPKIAFDSEIYNYGKVKTGTVIEYEFVFRNLGKDPLKILKSKPSCACTVSEIQFAELKNGQSSTMKVTFDTKGKTGQQHHNVTLFTNDPAKPIVVLYLQGEVTQ